METVPVRLINTSDRRFCISYPLHDDVLLRSIHQLGIIQPILLMGSAPHIVVTGFKRLESALKLGHPKIPCVFVDITQSRALLYSIHDNMKRGFNIVEKALCLERMGKMGFGSPEVYDTMALLALKPQDRILEHLLSLAHAEDVLKDFVVTRELSLKGISYMMKFDVFERQRVIEILSSLRVTASSLREILEMLILIKIKRGKIDVTGFEEARDADSLKKNLKAKTNPALSALDSAFKDLKHRCGLPGHVDIKVDPFFEKEYIDISIRAGHAEDVKDALEKLHRSVEAGHIGGMLDLAKG